MAMLAFFPWVAAGTSQGSDPDIYEPDDIRSEANVIAPNEVPQQHNFHRAEDVDWVKFAAKVSDEWYTFEATNVGMDADVVLELYMNDSAHGPAIRIKNNGWEGEDEILDWKCLRDGTYYLKVRNLATSVPGTDSGYDLELRYPIGPFSGNIVGYVTDAVTTLPVAGATITADSRIPGLSLQDGAYLIIHPPGTFTLTAQAPGYVQQGPLPVVVIEGGTILQNFQLTPLPTLPRPVIMANGASGQVSVPVGSPVQIAISLNSGTQVLKPADWWLVQQTPTGILLCYDLSQGMMVNGFFPTYQGGLFEFGRIPLMTLSNLTSGSHVFYFGVDMNPNGTLDMGVLYFDYVCVSVGSGAFFRE